MAECWMQWAGESGKAAWVGALVCVCALCAQFGCVVLQKVFLNYCLALSLMDLS